jgi:hypothetical protein
MRGVEREIEADALQNGAQQFGVGLEPSSVFAFEWSSARARKQKTRLRVAVFPPRGGASTQHGQTRFDQRVVAALVFARYAEEMPHTLLDQRRDLPVEEKGVTTLQFTELSPPHRQSIYILYIYIYIKI